VDIITPSRWGGVQEAVPVTFTPAGEARLDLYTDALILDIGRDTFVVPLTPAR